MDRQDWCQRVILIGGGIVLVSMFAAALGFDSKTAIAGVCGGYTLVFAAFTVGVW